MSLSTQEIAPSQAAGMIYITTYMGRTKFIENKIGNEGTVANVAAHAIGVVGASHWDTTFNVRPRKTGLILTPIII